MRVKSAVGTLAARVGGHSERHQHDSWTALRLAKNHGWQIVAEVLIRAGGEDFQETLENSS